MFWWIIGFIVLLIILIIVTKVRIEISYKRESDNDCLLVTISAWFNLIKLTYEIPLIKIKLKANQAESEIVAKVEREGATHTETGKSIDKSEVKRLKERYNELLEKVNDLHPILKDVSRRVYCEKLEWNSTLGIGDAAGTGALTGLVYGVKSMLIGMFSHYISLRAVPRINVQPEWNNTIIRTQFNCILTFRVGHAMVAGIRILLKMKKGSVRKWQTTPFRA